MEQIDLLFIHHLPVIGGATQSMLLVINEALARGLRCKVLFLRSHGNALDWYAKEGITFESTDAITTYAHAQGAYRSFFSRKPWYPITRLIKAFRDTKKAIVYLESLNPKAVYLNTSVLIPFARAAKELGLPVIWHLREQLHSGNLGIRRQIIRNCFKKNADLIFAISKVNAAFLGMPGVRIVYNNVDFNQFDPAQNHADFRSTYGIMEDEKLISFLGGRVESKGAPLFVEAALNVLQQGYTCKFVIAGHFNEDASQAKQNAVEQKVSQLLAAAPSYRSQFIFTGSLANVAPLLGNTYALAWPAVVPHFARPIIEAMVMATPVIASDFPSSAEIMDSGQEGLLVTPTVTAFVNAMVQLLDQPRQVEEMGQAGREKALDLFQASKNNKYIIDQIVPLINE